MLFAHTGARQNGRLQMRPRFGTFLPRAADDHVCIDLFQCTNRGVLYALKHDRFCHAVLPLLQERLIDRIL